MYTTSILQALLSSTELTFFAIDQDYNFISFSNAYADTIRNKSGLEIQMGKSIWRYIGDEKLADEIKSNVDRAMHGEVFSICEKHNAQFFTSELYKYEYFPIVDNGITIGVGVLITDVTYLLHKEKLDIFSELINTTQNGVTLADAKDPELPLIFANKAFETITGYSADEVMGKNCRFLQNEDRNQEALQTMKHALVNQKSCNVKLRNYKKDGTFFYNQVVLSPIFDSEGELRYFAGIQNDITDLYNTQQYLLQETLTDPLTKIKNRKAFQEKTQELYAQYQRYGNTFCMAILDIDDFKKINDSFGHDIGDKAIVEIAQLISDHIRKSDYLFRIGGEEFVILFTHTTLDKAMIAAENIRVLISNTKVASDRSVSVSIGIDHIDINDSPDTLFKRVDALLYQAKAQGKNRTLSPLESF